MNREDEVITKENITELLNDLAKISSPYFHENQVLDYIFDWLKSNDLPAEYHHYEDIKVTKFAGKNIIGKLKGKEEGTVVLLNGHVDTVNICNGWTKDPLNPVVEDGKMFGVGVLDMKSGVCAIMLALKAFVMLNESFKGEILYHFVSDEEGPYGLGTNFIIEDGLADDADVSIVPEPSSGFCNIEFPCVCLGARGGFQYDIRFFGTSSHAATPELGVNAIEQAAKLIKEFENVDLIEDEKLGKGSICIIGMNGGGQACSVADTAVINIFRHIVVGEDKATVLKEIEDAAIRAGVECRYEVVFREAPTEDSGAFMPYTSDGENPYVKSFLHATQEVTGKDPTIAYFSSIGDYCYLGSRLNIPTIVFGPNGGNFHGADEYVNIQDAVNTSKVIYNYLKTILL